MRGTCLVAIAIALSVLGCGGRDVAPYLATLDGLGLPSDWQVLRTEVRSQGGQDGCVEVIDGHCPSVTRYYAASGPLPAILQAVNDRAAASGFADISVVDPACEAATSSVEAACFLAATKNDMAVLVTVYRPGSDVDGLGVSLPEMPTVRIILRRS
jgi:hypothetical protein